MAKVAATTEPSADASRSLFDQISARRKALSIREFAEILGISPTTIYDAARTGSLPAIRIGSAIRLDPKACVEWLRQHSS